MDISIKNIVFATDFSECAQQAQRYAIALAVPLCARLHVLHVVTDPSPLPGITGLTTNSRGDELSQIEKRAEEKLQAQMGDDLQRYPSIRCVVRAGNPAQQIQDYARTHEADIIILGTHGRKGLSHLVVGSVAEEIVRVASCPVLTVHSNGDGRILKPSADAKS